MDANDYRRLMQARSRARGLAQALVRLARLSKNEAVRITITTVQGDEYIGHFDVSHEAAESLTDAVHSVVDHAVCDSAANQLADAAELYSHPEILELANAQDDSAQDDSTVPADAVDPVLADPLFAGLRQAVEDVFCAEDHDKVGHWPREAMEIVNGPYQPGALRDLAHIDNDKHMPADDDADGDL